MVEGVYRKHRWELGFSFYLDDLPVFSHFPVSVFFFFESVAELYRGPRFVRGDGMSMLIRQSAWIFGDSAPMGRKEGVGGSSIRAAKKLDKCFWLGLAGSQALFKSLKLLSTI